MIRIELQRQTEVLLRLGPLPGALIGDAAEIVDAPVPRLRLAHQLQPAGIGLHRFLPAFVCPQDIAQGEKDLVFARVILAQPAQQGDGLIGALQIVKVERDLDLRRNPQRMRLWNAAIGGDGLVELAHVLIDLAEQHPRHRIVRPHAQGHAVINEGDIQAAIVDQRRGQREQRLRHALPGGADHGLWLLARMLLQIGKGCLDDGGFRRRLQKGAIDLACIVDLAMPPEEIGVGLRHAQGARDVPVGAGIELFGPGRRLQKVRNQGAVKIAKAGKGLVFLQFFERRQRLGQMALAGVGPGGEQSRGQFADRGHRRLAEMLARLRPAALFRRFQAQHRLRQPRARIGAHDSLCQRIRLGPLAAGGIEHKGAMQQRRIGRIIGQGGFEKACRMLIVALPRREAPGQIAARAGSAHPFFQLLPFRFRRILRSGLAGRHAGRHEGEEQGEGISDSDVLARKKCGHGSVCAEAFGCCSGAPTATAALQAKSGGALSHVSV